MRSALQKHEADSGGVATATTAISRDGRGALSSGVGSCGRSPIVDFFASVWERQPKMDYDVHVIKEGYSLMSNDGRTMVANGTSTLVRGTGFNVIVDTLSAWDKDFLIESLSKLGVSCDEVNYVVCTHGHSDHIGNLNLFQRATHIIGTSVSNGDVYQLDTFDKDEPYRIATDVQIIPTPGHTLSDVSVIVKTAKLGTVAITGDLFEKAEDIDDPRIWREVAGSEDPKQQVKSRQMILHIADFVVPGHGPMFKVTDAMREKHLELLDCTVVDGLE
uniref:Metallo-beta-lactamase domain-containing protein 1 n=1 Tax=Ixodes ricinus TaxID=34613 RepID=A0A131Y7H7_IXORI